MQNRRYGTVVDLQKVAKEATIMVFMKGKFKLFCTITLRDFGGKHFISPVFIIIIILKLPTTSQI